MLYSKDEAEMLNFTKNIRELADKFYQDYKAGNITEENKDHGKIFYIIVLFCGAFFRYLIEIKA